MKLSDVFQLFSSGSYELCPTAPLYLHQLWKQPKLQVRYLLCTFMKSWDDPYNQGAYCFFWFSIIFLLLFIIPSPLQCPLPAFFFFSFFLASVGFKHCTMLKSLGIVVHEWAFEKHLLCFHEEVPKASFRASDPTFIMYGKYWRKRG